MAQADWDPLKELQVVQQRMNKLFETALARTNFDAEGGVGAWVPVSDVYETPDGLVVCLELPGLSAADIDVRVDGDDLVVQGERGMEREHPGEQYHRVERSYGKFARRFALPSDVDRNSAAADYKNGVLTIRLTRRESDGRKPIRLEIR
jgi:HSP20 family protein